MTSPHRDPGSVARSATEPAAPAPALVCTGSQVVYSNPWMTVHEDDLVWPDGTTHVYGIIDKPDFAVVLAHQDGGFWLVEQYRHPIRQRSWEFPMGGWPPGHPGGTPLELARTELAEETGLRADSWTHLGRLDAASGHTTSRFDVYLATGLHPGEHRREPSEADMTQRFVTEDELSGMIHAGRLTNAQSLAAWVLFREHVARSGI